MVLHECCVLVFAPKPTFEYFLRKHTRVTPWLNACPPERLVAVPGTPDMLVKCLVITSKDPRMGGDDLSFYFSISK